MGYDKTVLRIEIHSFKEAVPPLLKWMGEGNLVWKERPHSGSLVGIERKDGSNLLRKAQTNITRMSTSVVLTPTPCLGT